MAELALDDVDRDPLPRELDGVRVPKLMRREPAPDPSLSGELAQLRPGRARRPRPPARDPVDHAEQRTDRQLDPISSQDRSRSLFRTRNKEHYSDALVMPTPPSLLCVSCVSLALMSA